MYFDEAARLDIREDDILVADFIGVVRVLAVDSDVRARVWVIELDRPDRDHFLERKVLRPVTHIS